MYNNSVSLPSVVSHESVHATASEQLNDQLTTPHYKTRQALSLRLRRLSLWLSQDSTLLRQSMGIGLSRRDALDICLACIMTSCAIIAGNMVHEPLHRAALALMLIPSLRIGWRATGYMLHALQDAEYDAEKSEPRHCVASTKRSATASIKGSATPATSGKRRAATTLLSSHLPLSNTPCHV